MAGSVTSPPSGTPSPAPGGSRLEPPTPDDPRSPVSGSNDNKAMRPRSQSDPAEHDKKPVLATPPSGQNSKDGNKLLSRRYTSSTDEFRSPRRLHDESDLADERPLHHVTLMVIAMEKKVMAKPMQRLILLSLSASLGGRFVSTCCHRYPLSKVQDYVKLRSPFLLNDLATQHLLLDRQSVYEILEENGIPSPPHMVLRRSAGDVVVEREDAIEINGKVMPKPFVMKPLDAENHNIYVYFSQHDGGGAQHLFRKKKDKASAFLPDCNTIPEEGDFIFEQFLPTGGTDIKVYTVGPNYAHAEGRKAPVVDGKVLRDANGKEVRCPILLTTFEKDIARRVTQAFKQNVCGFDLLRTSDNKSFVCDVNGWSFVKRSPHYYVDCARILREMILSAISPLLLNKSYPVPSVDYTSDSTDLLALQSPQQPLRRDAPELRCVIAVIRHSDRTPKEKLKMNVTHVELLEVFKRWSPEGMSATKEVKLKSRKHLQDVLRRVQNLLRWDQRLSDEEKSNLKQIEHVLTRWPISGINRKVQFKPTSYVHTRTGKPIINKAQLIVKWGGEVTPMGLDQAQKAGVQFRETMYPSSDQDNGLLRLHSTYRHDLKLYSSDEGRVQMTAAAFAKGLLQLDGEITPILVSLVRKDNAVNALLDDTKPARAQMDEVKKKVHGTLLADQSWPEVAAKIAPLSAMSYSQRKALRKLDNPHKAMTRLYNLVVDFVTSLGDRIEQDPNVRAYQGEPLVLLRRRWEKLRDEFFDTAKQKFVVSKIPDIHDSIKYHLQHNAHFGIDQSSEILTLSQHLANVVVPQEYGVTNEEKLGIGYAIGEDLMRKIVHDLRVSAGQDAQHDVFQHEVSHRLNSGDSFIKVRSPNRHVRTRLYFTSESHIHALVNVLRCGDYGLFSAGPTRKYSYSDLVEGQSKDDQAGATANGDGDADRDEDYRSRAASDLASRWQPRLQANTDVPLVSSPEAWLSAKAYICKLEELGYLTHIVCRLFERHDMDGSDPARFFVEWALSPGLRSVEDSEASAATNHDVELAPLRILHTGMTLEQVERFFQSLPSRVTTPTVSESA
ncbi:uncharacterized protein MONBRDRAFT_37460 [Monosiga brevicollis MX1]|uniref:Inositol hexakisphosphate and diphosphoinositol-pentakisphosphate kinase n=1 Tax=Monosiga brevicollis TaxID=81824 RepID=A9V1V8_MONBE|nr:uncharacterized protein MONBRDRAFT_37460 [Monosiga brevicollis MX1]EDQ88512.1 predicted protein [Monosiga brevicollis MX1]|eukprot:XP_001746616.1 hypothetical protein [Monosiga brevicollis MX1]